jgi:hypothetical protein
MATATLEKPPVVKSHIPEKLADIYMLAEVIPAQIPDAILGVPESNRQTVNVHWKLGFFADKHDAEEAATHHTLKVVAIEDGMARTRT